MIDIGSLSDKDVGRWVIYHKGARVNRGRIKGWSDRYVYVVYWAGYDEHLDQFKEYTAVPTRPEDLSFDEP